MAEERAALRPTMSDIKIRINSLPSSLWIKEPNRVTLGRGSDFWALHIIFSAYDGEVAAGMPVISSTWIASASCEGREASDPPLVFSVSATQLPNL